MVPSWELRSLKSPTPKPPALPLASHCLKGSKASALSRVIAVDGDDDVTFLKKDFAGETASKALSDYISAISDELKDDPVAVSILDGNTLKLFLEDEDDYAMLAENLFTDLDIEDKGKFCKSELRRALIHMRVEMGFLLFQESGEGAARVDNEFRDCMKDNLEKFIEQLEANPIYCDLDD